MATSTSNIDWNDVIKKEARGSGDEDLGEVQEVGSNYVLVQKGLLNKEKFYIPKDKVESYDGHKLRFRITEAEVQSKYMGDSVERRPVSGTTSTTSTSDRPVESEQEIRVPLKQEQVQVTKQPYVKEEVAVKKKPVTETKTVSDQVTSEEVRVKGTNIEEEE